MWRFLALVLAFCLCLFPVSVGALTYAEYLADQGYSQDEIDQIISSGEDASASESSDSTIYIDNSKVLDSGSSVQVESLTVQAETVLMSAPENNDYPSGAPLAGGVYMQVTTSALGELLIYVPSNYQSKALLLSLAPKRLLILQRRLLRLMWSIKRIIRSVGPLLVGCSIGAIVVLILMKMSILPTF